MTQVTSYCGGRRRGKRTLISALAVLCLAGTLFAQQSPAKAKPAEGLEKGFSTYAEFGGSANSEGHVLQLNTVAGYNFTSHVGMNFGVPFYMVGGSTTSGTTKTSYSNSGIGAPFAGLTLLFNNPKVNYGTTFTTYLPTGDTTKGFSTGRTSFDWNNRVERSFSRVTPFAEAGMGNTVVDSAHFHRPYSSYGYNAHFQAGMSVEMSDKVSVGGSGYEIAPWGTQTLYSRTVAHTSSSAAANSASQNRFFDASGVTTGTSSIAKDNGFSAWLDFSPTPGIDTEASYTRSVQFALNTVSFSVRFNLRKLAKDGDEQ